jgi:ribose/xylose/arabinose/galactoside ABC-type transport system permease subunit
LNLAAAHATYGTWVGFERLQMTALAKSIARAFPASSSQVDIVRQVSLFALAGLFVWALIATYGIDLSPGFF